MRAVAALCAMAFSMLHVRDAGGQPGDRGATHFQVAAESRPRRNIEVTFDRNKGALYALYGRALRDNPTLKGKIVFDIKISPAGEVIACRIVSSELGNPDLEKKLAARIALMRFGVSEGGDVTVTKPIEFFPATGSPRRKD